MAPCSTKSHVALLTSPGMGHVIPLFALAHRLVAHHNCHVSVLVIASSPSQRHLINSAPTDHVHVIDLPIADMSHFITEDMHLVTRLSHIVNECIRTSLKSVLVDLNGPKALIIDPFCAGAIDICRELEIPVYSFMTMSVTSLAFCLYLPKLDLEVEEEKFSDIIEPVQIPGCRPVRRRDVMEPAQNLKIDEYKWLLYHVSQFPKVDGIIVNSWEDLEPMSTRAIKENQFYRDIPTPPLYPVGPIMRQTDPKTELHVDILNFLDKQPLKSVLFVALGSGGTLTTHQLTELALGLELSQERFVLVARKPSDYGTWSAFFNMGEDKDDQMSYLPKGFIERVDGVGLVVPDWAPQQSVLRHMATGGFLSHCGWNSALESISCGVPMIAWPLYAEQRMNAAMLVEEVGVAMWPTGKKEGEEVVDREEIAKVIKEVMEGKEGNVLRNRAINIKESAKKALDIDGSSSQALSRFVKNLAIG